MLHVHFEDANMMQGVDDNEEEIILATRYAQFPPDNEHQMAGYGEEPPKKRRARSPTKVPHCAWILTFMASLSGFLYGYDMTAIRQSAFYIRRFFSLEAVWTDVVVSSTYVGALIFSCLSGYVVDMCGRKATLIAATLFFSAGSTISGLSVNVSMLIAGRFLLGLGEGLITATTIIYVSECIYAHHRGRMVGMFAMFYLVGQIAANFLTNFLSIDSERGWRYVLGAATVPSMVQAIGMAFLPESPRWLMKKGRELHCREALDAITPRMFVADEMRRIRVACKESKLPQTNTGTSKLSQVLHSPALRRALVTGCGLHVFQILSGGLFILHFLQDVFRLSFDMKEHSTLLAIGPTFLGLVSCCIGLYLIERIGRKKLLFISITGLFGSLVISAVGLQIGAYTTVMVNKRESDHVEKESPPFCDFHRNCDSCVKSHHCGFCFRDRGEGTTNGSCVALNDEFPLRALHGRCQQPYMDKSLYWSLEVCPNPRLWISAVGFALFMMLYNSGISFLPWVINSEIFPFWSRGTSVAITTTVHWICELVLGLTMHILIDVLSKHGTFWVFASLSLSGLIFVWITVPETTNKSIEDAEDFFAEPWFARATYSSLEI